MNNAKSKHVSMPKETYDKVTQLCERLGCSFSKVVQIALEERLPQWELQLGDFQIKEPRTFEEMVMQHLRKSKRTHKSKFVENIIETRRQKEIEK